jgi:transcriptional regulator with XRE-family HTH domain
MISEHSTLSKTLTDLLVRDGRSQRTVSRVAGLSPGFLNDLLAGRRTGLSADSSRRLARALGCEVSLIRDAAGLRRSRPGRWLPAKEKDVEN